ncbi:unnamed protein product [Parnassius mnemosyne]|uniref:DDE Tnp4 domain-containing protein n=1 Tax=Parnassius mnemosyne TaxID=213953 RepID=A0AAV1LWF7_9NEOP
MDYDTRLRICIYLILTARKQKRKHYWVHPLTAMRLMKGFFYMRYNDLRKFPKKFFGYYRMNITTFDNLKTIVGNEIYYKDTSWRNAISVEERLSVTLRYLASGNSINSLYYEYLIGATTIREIVEDTCEKFWECLQPIYMQEPDEDTWNTIAKKFYKRTNFPNCLGSVDGKHIRCKKPDNAGSQYFNYKQYHSIVLMAVANADYSFVSVDVGAYGGNSDSKIFKNCNFGKNLERTQLNLPESKTLPNDEDGKVMPLVFVGDEAFAQSEHVMRPYPRRNLTITQRVFNYRLTRARRVVECTFGILTNKWRILYPALDVKTTTCDKIVKACCILHNYVRKHDGVRSRDELYGTQLISFRRNPVRSTINSLQNRDYFANYFTSIRGSVPWQYDKI